MQLKLSTDRKVTPKAKLSGGRWVPEVPNAFGLPAHLSCPGKTSVCESICYAFKLEKAYTNVSKLLKNNWEVLSSCGDDVSQIESLLIDMLNQYIKIHANVERLRDTKLPLVFRIHWDGDFYSLAYAEAWANAIKAFPEIKFWAYTRSFRDPINVVSILADIENLSLYLSIDDANFEDAGIILNKYPNVHSAFLAPDFDLAMQNSLELIGKKSPKCPEQTGRYDLIENGRGACVECGLCIKGVNDVCFSISKK